jgi:hypothetical protein
LGPPFEPVATPVPYRRPRRFGSVRASASIGTRRRIAVGRPDVVEP